MNTIKTVNVASIDHGTRKGGAELRSELVGMKTDEGEWAIIDFGGTEIISSGWADEVFGMTVRSMGFMWFNEYIHVVNTDETIKAVRERLESMD